MAPALQRGNGSIADASSSSLHVASATGSEAKWNSLFYEQKTLKRQVSGQVVKSL